MRQTSLLLSLAFACGAPPSTWMPPHPHPATNDMAQPDIRLNPGSGRLVASYIDCPAPASIGLILDQIQISGKCETADCTYAQPNVCNGTWSGQLNVVVTAERFGCIESPGVDLTRQCIFTASTSECPASHPVPTNWVTAWTDTRSCSCNNYDSKVGCSAIELGGGVVKTTMQSCCKS